MKKDNEFYTEHKMKAYKKARLNIKARELAAKKGVSFDVALSLINQERESNRYDLSKTIRALNNILSGNTFNFSTPQKSNIALKEAQASSELLESVQPTDLENTINYVGPRVNVNSGGMIGLSAAQRLPPYRRGVKLTFLSTITNKPLQPKEAIIAPNSLLNLLLALNEDERKNFTSWCYRQGKIPDSTMLSEFKATLPEPDINFTRRDYRESGWVTVKVRNTQEKFRQDVLANWEGRCAVTGSSLAIEACHIISHANKGAPSVENGIALAADLHRLFDSGHLYFKNGYVLLSVDAQNEPRYSALHGMKIRKPITPVDLPN